MTEKGNDQKLQALLQRPPADVSTADIELLAQSLGPASLKTTRSLAFACLSRLAQSIATGQSAHLLEKAIQPYISATFEPENDDPATFVPFVSLLSALFSLAPAPALAILRTKLTHTVKEGEAPDILDVLLETAELPSSLQPALAELLGQAASTKDGREVVQRAETWLRGAVNYGDYDRLGALCAVALSKLGPGENKEEGESEDETRALQEIELAKKMMDHIISSGSSTDQILPTLEGLSILSTKGHIKHLLSTSPAFLKSLLAFSPVPDARPSSLPVTPRGSVEIDEKIFEPVETSLCYGLTVVLVNLTARTAVLSAEDEQIAKLRAMAISGEKGAPTPEEDPFGTDAAVDARVATLVKAGVVPALKGLGRADSLLVKESLGRLCLNLVNDKAHRPIFVRDGGFRVLSAVVRDLMTTSDKKAAKNDKSAESATTDYLPAVQALAKLVITTPPHLLFPPPYQTTSLNALNPLYHLLCHPSSSLLQMFEALMALTNLATIDASIADRIVSATIIPPVNDTMWQGAGRDSTVNIITRIEELMLDDNNLVRRAATELVCNLVNCPKGIIHFAGESATSEPSARVKSRLNVLLVLTTVDDPPTRLAAGGALAILSEYPQASAALLSIQDETKNRTTWTRVMHLLDPDAPGADEEEEDIPVISTIPPNPELVHRAVIVLLNFVEYVAAASAGVRRHARMEEARKAGLEEKMMEVIKGNMTRREILEPAVELLKTLKRYPA